MDFLYLIFDYAYLTWGVFYLLCVKGKKFFCAGCALCIIDGRSAVLLCRMVVFYAVVCGLKSAIPEGADAI